MSETAQKADMTGRDGTCCARALPEKGGKAYVIVRLASATSVLCAAAGETRPMGEDGSPACRGMF